jgi:hypothetical protein
LRRIFSRRIALRQDRTTPCHQQQVFLLAQWDNGYSDANCLSNKIYLLPVIEKVVMILRLP